MNRGNEEQGRDALMPRRMGAEQRVARQDRDVLERILIPWIIVAMSLHLLGRLIHGIGLVSFPVANVFSFVTLAMLGVALFASLSQVGHASFITNPILWGMGLILIGQVFFIFQMAYFGAGPPAVLLSLGRQLGFSLGLALWVIGFFRAIFAADHAKQRLESEQIDLLREMDERKHAEDALRESEQRFRQLADAIREAFWLTNPDRNEFLYISPAFAEIWGIDHNRVMAEPGLWMESIHGEDRERIRQILAQDNWWDSWNVEYRIIRSSGEVRWIHGQAFPIRKPNGEVYRVAGVAEDITERKQNEEALVRAYAEVETRVKRRTESLAEANQRLEQEIEERKRAQQLIAEHRAKFTEAAKLSILGEMAASIAHEINNPLNIISGSAEQLQTIIQGENEEMRPFIPSLGDVIVRNVFRVKKIVTGLRSFARDSSEDPFKMTAIKSIMDDTVTLYLDAFSTHQVRLDVGPIPDGLVINCRPTQLMEVLANLLSNALHAVECVEDKWVSVSVDALDHVVRIAVMDSGPGIAPVIAERIFEPLVTTKQPGKGTGLGLSISKRIVESHHGTLAVDPASPNTRFVVELPR